MKKLFIAIVSLSLLATGCKGEGKTSNATNQESNQSEVKNQETSDTKSTGDDAICLLDKLSVRETPTAKGKWVTSMSLGEKVAYTGEQHTDSITKKDYVKVRLIDGKEGWARAPFIAVNGKVAVMLENTNTYKRPDLLTKTNNKYSPMDIIAVMSTQDDWIQVKGKRGEGRYIEEAWVKSSNISEKQIDIAVAKFAGLAMSKETMTERIKALEEIVNNADFSSSTFIDVLKTKIEDYKSKNKEVDAKDAVEAVEEAQ